MNGKASSSHGPANERSYLDGLGTPVGEIGVLVVDHGSRRDGSNDLLHDVVAMLREETAGLTKIEPAHMEIAEPSLEVAFDRCVAHGARLVVIVPYFLGTGRHLEEDIPRLAAEAAARHKSVRWQVTKPLGLHPLITRILRDRIEEGIAALLSNRAGWERDDGLSAPSDSH